MKTKQINIRLNDEIYNMLQFKSKATNMTATDYITTAINGSDIKVDNSKDIGRLIGAINKVGNNINQIAHNLNIANNSDKLDDVDYSNLLNKLVIIEHQLNSIAKGVL